MSILIRGMEMPTSCWLCPLSVLLEKPREMLFCRIIKEEVLRNKVDGNCPLIEVPPHGRLIDADDTENITVIMNENGSGFNRIIAPTIIEAEEGE